MNHIEKANFDSIMKKENFEIHHSKDAYADYPPGSFSKNPVALHHHDYYEIFYFISGAVTYHIEGKEYLLQSGDLLFISPLELHQPLFVHSHGHYERIVLWIQPSFLKLLSQISSEDLTSCFQNTTHNLLRLPKAASEELFFLLEQLSLKEHQPTPFYHSYSRGILLHFLAALNHYATEPSHFFKPQKAYPAAVTNGILYLQEHFTEPISIQDVAKHCYCSPSYLMSMFKSHTGLTIHQYLLQKRLMLARQLLQENLPATEVYSLCGFTDYSTFYRAFYKNYHTSPTKAFRTEK